MHSVCQENGIYHILIILNKLWVFTAGLKKKLKKKKFLPTTKLIENNYASGTRLWKILNTNYISFYY